MILKSNQLSTSNSNIDCYKPHRNPLIYLRNSLTKQFEEIVFPTKLSNSLSKRFVYLIFFFVLKKRQWMLAKNHKISSHLREVLWSNNFKHKAFLGRFLKSIPLHLSSCRNFLKISFDYVLYHRIELKTSLRSKGCVCMSVY